MERARLIMNPEARGVTPAMQHVVEAALEARFKLDTATTPARHTAIDLAREAAELGAEMVVAFGGDGLVNEVVNGVVGSDTTVGIVPGGTMNVLARNLRIPRDILEATDLILRKAGQEPPLEITLGKAGDRYFSFVCGCGFDGDAARRVEEHKTTKRAFGEPYFYAAGLATFIGSYFGREPFLSIEGDFGVERGVMAAALNTDTYAYLARRRVRLAGAPPSPGHLNLFVMRSMRMSQVPVYGIGALVSGRFGKNAFAHRELADIDVEGNEPFGVHVDGEPLTPPTRIEIRATKERVKILV